MKILIQKIRVIRRDHSKREVILSMTHWPISKYCTNIFLVAHISSEDVTLIKDLRIVKNILRIIKYKHFKNML